MIEPPNRIVEFLTAPLKPEGDACRTNRRRRSSSPVELSWPHEQGWRTIRGRLRDISRAGAGLLALESPPATAHARIRLAGSEETPWIEAEILGVDRVSRNRRRVRLRFAEACPSFFLRLAILGEIEAEVDAPPDGLRFAWGPIVAE